MLHTVLFEVTEVTLPTLLSLAGIEVSISIFSLQQSIRGATEMKVAAPLSDRALSAQDHKHSAFMGP